MAAKKNFYAVRVGRNPGIYKTCAECQRETTGFKGAVFKGFVTLEEAQSFMGGQKSAATVKDIDWAIFVDGSYFNGKYSWGIAVYHFGELVHTANGVGESPDAAKHRNISGEVEGAIQAAKWADDNNVDKFTIFHDYQGIAEWAEGRWKTNTDLTAAYAEFMAKYRGHVSFQKVAGHTGVEGNELADKLAKQALDI